MRRKRFVYLVTDKQEDSVDIAVYATLPKAKVSAARVRAEYARDGIALHDIDGRADNDRYATLWTSEDESSFVCIDRREVQ